MTQSVIPLVTQRVIPLVTQSVIRLPDAARHPPRAALRHRCLTQRVIAAH
ncbi:hypothetical protein [Mesorhizobium sp.]|nr:hypothetical protein [Mesorhizobium sp.]